MGYWDDPEKFAPERFEKDFTPGTFVPFSDGPRSCIGQHFARFEFLVTLSVLLRKFDFVPGQGYQFGMMFNGFGWMATDMGDMMAGSQVRVQVKSKQKATPLALYAVLGLQAAALAYG